MELILTERSEGAYGAPALHGMLTASVVGPKPVPLDWILQTVLSPPVAQAANYRKTVFLREVRITYLHELGHYLGWDEGTDRECRPGVRRCPSRREFFRLKTVY
jgi:hypothetical protein